MGVIKVFVFFVDWRYFMENDENVLVMFILDVIFIFMFGIFVKWLFLLFWKGSMKFFL